MRQFCSRYLGRALGAALLFCATGQHSRASWVIEETPRELRSALSGPSLDIGGASALYCMALAVYFEGGSTGETEEGQRHIARVIHQRAKANLRKWGGSDICDVVFHKRAGVCQFSFACLPTAQRTPRGGAAWKYSMTIADDELGHRANVIERSARYYMNPALTSDRNACRFRKEFVPVLNAGRHEFFREPTSEERAALQMAMPIECKRHAEAVEARRRAENAARKKQAGKKRFAKITKRKLVIKSGKSHKQKYARR